MIFKQCLATIRNLIEIRTQHQPLYFVNNKFQKILYSTSCECLKMALSEGWITVLEYLVIFHPRVMYRDHRNQDKNFFPLQPACSTPKSKKYYVKTSLNKDLGRRDIFKEIPLKKYRLQIKTQVENIKTWVSFKKN